MILPGSEKVDKNSFGDLETGPSSFKAAAGAVFKGKNPLNARLRSEA
jgi:hypothetical protein